MPPSDSRNLDVFLQAKYGYSFQSAVEGTGLHMRAPESASARTSRVEHHPSSEDNEQDRKNMTQSDSEECDERQGFVYRSTQQQQQQRHNLLLPLRAPQAAAFDPGRRTPTIEEEEPELEKLL
jgi:hypothetical protein